MPTENQNDARKNFVPRFLPWLLAPLFFIKGGRDRLFYGAGVVAGLDAATTAGERRMVRDGISETRCAGRERGVGVGARGGVRGYAGELLSTQDNFVRHSGVIGRTVNREKLRPGTIYCRSRHLACYWLTLLRLSL